MNTEVKTEFITIQDKRYYVSTVDTFDVGFETMVFPASDSARVIERLWDSIVTGVDFNKPLDEYTRHYETESQAKKGHKEIVKLLKGLNSQ